MTFSPQHRNSPQNLNSPLIRIDCSISIQILTFPNIVFHRLRACKIHPASIRPWYIEICAIHTTSDENNDNFHSTPSCVVVCGKLPATNYIAMRPLKWDTNQTSHITGRNNKQCASHNNLLIGITLNVPITHTHTHIYIFHKHGNQLHLPQPLIVFRCSSSSSLCSTCELLNLPTCVRFVGLLLAWIFYSIRCDSTV